MKKLFSSFSEVDLKSATEYAAEDADVTLRLYEILSERISDERLDKIYEVFEKPMVEVLSEIEINGVKVDKDYLDKLSKKFANKILKMADELGIDHDELADLSTASFGVK